MPTGTTESTAPNGENTLKPAKCKTWRAQRQRPEQQACMMRAQLSKALSTIKGVWVEPCLAFGDLAHCSGRQAAARAHDGPGMQIHAIVSNCYLSVAQGPVSWALFHDDASARSSLHICAEHYCIF